MEKIRQRILKGTKIFNGNLLLFLAICSISSIISIYIVPFVINKSITEQELSEGINQVSMTYGGALSFSTSEIMISIISFFQFLTISTILLIIAYIIKYKIDKNLFRIKRWRDWKFFIYISGISFIIIDFFQKLSLSLGDNFIINLILTIFSCYFIIIFSSILLPEEIPEVKI